MKMMKNHIIYRDNHANHGNHKIPLENVESH